MSDLSNQTSKMSNYFSKSTNLVEMPTGQTIGCMPFGILSTTAVDSMFFSSQGSFRRCFAAVVLPCSTKYEEIQKKVSLYRIHFSKKKCFECCCF